MNLVVFTLKKSHPVDDSGAHIANEFQWTWSDSDGCALSNKHMYKYVRQ